MAGQINRMLQRLITTRAKGDAILEMTTTTKLVLKGLDPRKYTDSSPDDPKVLELVRQVAKDMNVVL
jgi:hypothetical protein